MMNRVMLQGRLVIDPELRQTASGVPVASFRIAVDRDFKNKETGEKETDFINVVAWRSTAEFIARSFTKGRMILVEGRLQIRKYTDKDGNNRTTAEVVAAAVHFGDAKRDGDGEYAPAAPAPNYGTPSGDQFAELSEDDGEIPF